MTTAAPCLAVVHDLALAARFADRVLVMRAAAELVADGGAARGAHAGADRRRCSASRPRIADSAVGPIPILHRPL